MGNSTMDTDLRALYWPGAWRALYQQLQAATPASEARLRELLGAREEWLLAGPARFQPPNDASRKTARDALKAGKLVLAAGGEGKGGGQRVTLDGRLEQASLEMSAILVGPGPGPHRTAARRPRSSRCRGGARGRAPGRGRAAASPPAALAPTPRFNVGAPLPLTLSTHPPGPLAPQELDEVQTLLLLRRFAADTGAALAPPGAPAGGQAALEPARVVEVRGRWAFSSHALGAGRREEEGIGSEAGRGPAAPRQRAARAARAAGPVPSG
jgi:hypothetical protein